MTEIHPGLRRTVTLRSPSGDSLVRVRLLPAAVGVALALALAPRLTLLATLAALLRRMSLSVDGTPESGPTTATGRPVRHAGSAAPH
jgi:hypothetical protein